MRLRRGVGRELPDAERADAKSLLTRVDFFGKMNAFSGI